MKAYLAVTGSVFGLVTLAHILRIVYEPRFATDIWFLLLTIATAARSLWALRLFRGSRI